jgi:hypothetical protein
MPTHEYESLRFEDHPAVKEQGSTTSYVRAQNFVIAYSRLDAGASLAADSEDEYFAVLVEGAVEVESQGGSGGASGDAVIIVPPGISTVRAIEATTLFRVFAPPPAALLRLCLNAVSYATPREDVAPLAPWPVPPDGYKLRVYQYDKLRQGHRNVFRSTTAMISYAGHPGDGPRDPHRFSPHSHADFEQISLELWGSYTHHLRYPWEPDSTAWREDAHFQAKAPGITVMPVNVIHTSQAMDVSNRLVDVFAPPRLDFSLAGNCENNGDYPFPPGIVGPK